MSKNHVVINMKHHIFWFQFRCFLSVIVSTTDEVNGILCFSHVHYAKNLSVTQVLRSFS